MSKPVRYISIRLKDGSRIELKQWARIVCAGPELEGVRTKQYLFYVGKPFGCPNVSKRSVCVKKDEIQSITTWEVDS